MIRFRPKTDAELKQDADTARPADVQEAPAAPKSRKRPAASEATKGPDAGSLFPEE
jgi:hypothetical protein